MPSRLHRGLGAAIGDATLHLAARAIARRAAIKTSTLYDRADALIKVAFVEAFDAVAPQALEDFRAYIGPVDHEANGINFANFVQAAMGDEWWEEIREEHEEIQRTVWAVAKYQILRQVKAKGGVVKREAPPPLDDMTKLLKSSETIAVSIPGTTAFVDFSLADVEGLEWLARDTNYWFTAGNEVAWGEIGDQAARVMAKGVKEGLGRQEIAGMLEVELPAIAAKGYQYFDVVSSAGMVRSNSWGAVTQMVEAGVVTYELYAVGDERMCETCGFLHGEVFPIQVAIDAMWNAKASGNDPEAIKEAMPWLSYGDVEGKGVDDLISAGVSAPPFHGRCRCTIVVADIELIA